MKTIETKVYQYDELNDKAKERARDWWREGGLDYDWWDSTYEDAEGIGLRITGFDLGRSRDIEGKFEKSAEKVASLILAEHGKDCETFKTATAFLAERATLVTKHADPDSCSDLTHEGDEAIEECEAGFLKSLLEDYWKILDREMEYILSDEQVAETIVANEYEFTEDGKRFVVKQAKQPA